MFWEWFFAFITLVVIIYLVGKALKKILDAI